MKFVLKRVITREYQIIFYLDPEAESGDIFFRKTDGLIMFNILYIFSDLIVACFNIHKVETLVAVEPSENHFVDMESQIQDRNVYIKGIRYLRIK